MSIKIRLVKREQVKLYHKILSPVISIVIAFVFIAIILRAMGYNPATAYQFLFKGAFGNAYNFSETLVQATPLLFAGLGVAVALSMATMNIGAEGQFCFGAWAATGVGLYCQWIPQPLIIPTMIVVGFLAGGAWGVIAVLPKAIWGVDETITTLMLNYVALLWIDYFVFGPWRDTSSANLPRSQVLPNTARLTTIFGTRVDVSIFLALILAVALYIFFKKTSAGYQIRVIGQNTKAAKYAGMDIRKKMLLVMLLSGGLAGVAGVVYVSGAGSRLVTGVSAGKGYTALIIARLSKNNPLIIVLVSVLFGALIQGSYNLQLAHIPQQMCDMLQGAILFCALAGELFINNTLTIRVQNKESLVKEAR